MSDGRFVWITREQAVAIAVGHKRDLRKFADAWQAAPADAAEAVGKALDQFKDTYDAWATGAMDEAVLRALGMPEAPS